MEGVARPMTIPARNSGAHFLWLLVCFLGRAPRVAVFGVESGPAACCPPRVAQGVVGRVSWLLPPLQLSRAHHPSPGLSPLTTG